MPQTRVLPLELPPQNLLIVSPTCHTPSVLTLSAGLGNVSPVLEHSVGIQPTSWPYKGHVLALNYECKNFGSRILERQFLWTLYPRRNPHGIFRLPQTVSICQMEATERFQRSVSPIPRERPCQGSSRPNWSIRQESNLRNTTLRMSCCTY